MAVLGFTFVQPIPTRSRNSVGCAVRTMLCRCDSPVRMAHPTNGRIGSMQNLHGKNSLRVTGYRLFHCATMPRLCQPSRGE